MLTDLSSFDGTERYRCEMLRPDRYRHLFAALSTEVGVIGRGSGLSYCAASGGQDCRVVSSARFDRFLEFDRQKGQLRLEPGVKVGDLLAFAIGEGWTLPVVPGHPQITVGGCLAFNVHGKSPEQSGYFADCVRELTLFHPDHGEFVCSNEREPGLFELTLGGMGLTGFITQAVLQLRPLAGTGVVRRKIPVGNLHEAVTLMRDLAPSTEALYSWHDLNLRGESFGRGIVYAEHFDDGEVAGSGKGFRSLSSDTRRWSKKGVYGRWQTQLIGRSYYWIQRLGRAASRLDPLTAAFPIQGKEAYYRMYGRAGFREYQVLYPWDTWEGVVPEIARLIEHTGARLPLGSLKIFGGRSHLLTFSGSGVCLALDSPAGPSADELFAALDELTIAARGVVNLSKDSRISATTVQRIFPAYEEFTERLERFDPHRRFDSAVRRRLLAVE